MPRWSRSGSNWPPRNARAGPSARRRSSALPVFRPLAPELLRAALVSRIDATHPGDRPGRVLVDGPRCADPAVLAESLRPGLEALGRPTARVRDRTFWRDASLRLEHGRTDELTYAESWTDLDALRREVLDPLGSPGDGEYLPSLRDPDTNRSTRQPADTLAATGVLLVSGEMLLGRGLPFDLTVHLAVSSAARRRLTPAQWVWTLPVLDDWDATTFPQRLADIAVRYDDPAHPAVAGLS